MDNTAIFDQFAKRHIGINESELGKMLEVIGVSSLDQLIDETVPETIRIRREMNLPTALSEYEFLEELKKTAAKNKVFKSYIGLGYHPTITPSVILRNIFQNPGWYTQYTPYQAEISQGRLEALLNFQTTISDLTGLPIANASLLDEGTAAAEAMIMFHSQRNKKNKGASVDRFLVSDQVYPQTLDVLIARAEPLGIEVVSGDWRTFDLDDNVFGILLQYPAANGEICDFRSLTAAAKSKEVYVTVACDLLSLALLTPPGEWGADAAVGNSQRFGVPMGYGGPHAAFFACQEEYKRQIPGRIIGVSVDAHGHRALRMALQTREQHIRREKATSNICTAQALLAIMAGMYAVYHGPEGIRAIAGRIHAFTGILARNLARVGFKPENDSFFDTLSIPVDAATLSQLRELAVSKGVNFCYGDDRIGISLNETVNARDLELIFSIFAGAGNRGETFEHQAAGDLSVPESLQRKSGYLTHPVFNQFHSETKMMRYIKRLENKDISLVHSMIPLGSCTMKLNAATELLPVSWSEFADVHPFVPAGQVAGYLQIFSELESYLSEITGFAACSLQPNSGAQGEYAGLLTIRAYHLHNGDAQRNIVLIPSSAHGTNPASAVMAGMEVVVVQCDEKGNIDVEDLRAKAEQHKDRLSALMVTYPSTHGVFETGIKGICQLIHDCGGLVYMDGANMNAQVGLTSPGVIGADVCHLNLHKTFAIPHGGGGPGMGPICVNERLKPFLPGHVFAQTGGALPIRAVSSAPWGSASILLISYAYIRMLGRKGLLNATRFAILNANYIRARLDGAYSVLYSGEKGRSAHELIIDLRPFKALASAEDVAKRLMDYGFHAPTLSFPVAGTIMVEPTESEDKEELDRFCEAMLQIRVELDEIAKGEADPESNVLSNAPHTSGIVVADQWPYTYSREKAAFPLNYLREGRKFWPSAGRIDGAYGDRNLICTCPPLEDYMATER